ncbi:hypothetical protein INT47_004248 [Mucor saturninus]|uniref:SH3 domain-containing protein n=1 Tax=Mucor saturninus TaxID=64648 RepID=A0A8H7V537_9FUNG|nr:hypothetical protein INT47_004248 [Mucor saturninus]
MPKSHFKQKPFVWATSILALTGWSVAFGGACILKVLNGAWWVMIYQLCIIIGHLVVFMSGSMQHYRLAMAAFLASSIPLLTIQIDYVVQYTKTSIPKVPASAYVAGYIMLVTVQYLWLLVIGSDRQTWLGQLAHHPVYEPTPYYSEKMDQSLPSNAIMRPLQAVRKTPVEFNEKVQALHAYHASAEDPNELNFEKGEILEIVDRKGNWWQARKQNGAIGIIPSNYFAQ